MVTGKALGKAGDATANQFLVHALRQQRAQDGLLSEEEKDNFERLDQSRVWIVDPVDGTREYGERGPIGPSMWALRSMARRCWARWRCPARMPFIAAMRQWPSPHPTCCAVVSRTRPAAEAVFVAGELGAELVPMGSAGAKAMAVIRGEADIYLHSGGQFRMGQLRAGCGRSGPWPALQPDRRVAAGL
jgi:3'(2'), 5'-bisphosphate nucleotidase